MGHSPYCLIAKTNVGTSFHKNKFYYLEPNKYYDR